jgi:hypothetical protein
VIGDLVAFVRARQDEAEAKANTLFFACRNPNWMPDFTGCGGPAAEAYWQHFTGARMLRDVEVKRRIVERHEQCGTGVGYCDDGGQGIDGVGCAELLDLAAIDSDHWEYQAAWVRE